MARIERSKRPLASAVDGEMALIGIPQWSFRAADQAEARGLGHGFKLLIRIGKGSRDSQCLRQASSPR